jgi:hypothetical protein
MIGSPRLCDQIGIDTVRKLEAAVPWRLEEAEILKEAGRRLAAIYMYGYAVEMLVGAAYFRLIEYGLDTDITSQARRLAEKQARQEKLMSSEPHDLSGWAKLLIVTRQRRSTGFSQSLAMQLRFQADVVYDRWRPNLRYRTLVPTLNDVSAVRHAALWFQDQYGKLWG